jgi:hypothetical protein
VWAGPVAPTWSGQYFCSYSFFSLVFSFFFYNILKMFRFEILVQIYKFVPITKFVQILEFVQISKLEIHSSLVFVQISKFSQKIKIRSDFEICSKFEIRSDLIISDIKNKKE